MWYRAKAAPARARPQRRGRGSIPASPPTKSASGYLANENASHSSLLFPVITITGISDVNDINDLAICECISMRETLHLVVWGAQTARWDASGPAVRWLVTAVGRREFPGFSGLGKG